MCMPCMDLAYKKKTYLLSQRCQTIYLTIGLTIYTHLYESNIFLICVHYTHTAWISLLFVLEYNISVWTNVVIDLS